MFKRCLSSCGHTEIDYPATTVRNQVKKLKTNHLKNKKTYEPTSSIFYPFLTLGLVPFTFFQSLLSYTGTIDFVLKKID